MEILRLSGVNSISLQPSRKPMTPGEAAQAKPNPNAFLGREKVKGERPSGLVAVSDR